MDDHESTGRLRWERLKLTPTVTNSFDAETPQAGNQGARTPRVAFVRFYAGLRARRVISGFTEEGSGEGRLPVQRVFPSHFRVGPL
jgi:hypothetical protein